MPTFRRTATPLQGTVSRWRSSRTACCTHRPKDSPRKRKYSSADSRWPARLLKSWQLAASPLIFVFCPVRSSSTALTIVIDHNQRHFIADLQHSSNRHRPERHMRKSIPNKRKAFQHQRHAQQARSKARSAHRQ